MTAGSGARPGATKFARAGVALAVALGVSMGGIAPASAAFAPWSPHPEASRRVARVPVILVHGLASSGQAWRGTELYRALRAEGYREGVDLFLLDYAAESAGDYVSLAETRLAPLVREALRRTGHGRVDVVAHSMGGLVARAYLADPARRRTVRTLVLIASPGRGSPAASALKRASLVEPGWNPPAAHREHVEAMAAGVFAPLLDRLFAAAQAEREAPGDPFALLREREPAAYAAHFERQQEPLDGSGAAPGPPLRPPGPRADLTRAYLNAIAFDRAVAARLSGTSPGGEDGGDTGDDGGAEEPEGSGNLLLKVAGWAGVPPDSVAVDRLVRRTWDVPAAPAADGNPRFDPLLANHFLAGWTDAEPAWRAAGGAVISGAELPHPEPKYVVIAGAIPNPWRSRAPWVGDNDGLVEVDSAFIPQGENDAFRLFAGAGAGHSTLKQMPAVASFVVQHLREFFPPRRRHAPTPARGWWRSGVRRFEAREPLRPWEPTFIEVSAARLDGASGRLAFELRFDARAAGAGGPAAAPSVRAYLESAAGDRIDRRPVALTPVPGGWEATLFIDGFGADVGRVWLGARAAAAEIGRRFTAAAFRAVPLEMAYRVRWDPAPEPDLEPAARSTPPSAASAEPVRPTARAGGDGAGAAMPHGGRTPPRGLAGTPGDSFGAAGLAREAGPPGVAVDAGVEAAAGEEEIPDPVEAPPPPDGLIVVHRRTKRISRLEATKTVHQRWEWDFGDGHVFTDLNPAHVRSLQVHAYAAPGLYRVTATSWSNHGGILRRQTWLVPGPPPAPPGGPAPPAVHTFLAESISEPRLRFELDAPRKWMAGRPADVRVVAEVSPPPYVDRVEVDVDPARSFQVLWVRPGRFTVRVAAVVRLTYRFPEGAVRVRNVYVREAEVDVLTTALTG